MSQSEKVDELRQRLRALGYLDGGVDRFVLGPARGRRRPVTIAVLASLRVGIIAALLLGPAAAIGVGSRLPGLITGARDAAVVALYLGALFGAAATIGACLASLAVSALARERAARRAKPMALAAGAVVTVASLAYLTLWWRTANAGLGWSAPVWTAFALAVAVAISLLLGHAVRVTALAVMMSAHHDTGGVSPDRGPSSWKMAVTAAVLAFAGAATLLMVTARNDAHANAGPAVTVVSTGVRVRVIAIDGFDPGIFEQLAGAGRLPALGSALSSTRGRLAPEPSRDPARVWTTIATGQPAERHGVRGLETRRVAGIQGTMSKETSSPLADALRGATDLLRLTSPAIASGTERREKTFWEVAADAGLRTAVVNWWATWPAPAGGGDGPIVLTDRAILRLERGSALDAEIAPPEVYDRLRANWAALRSGATARAAQSLGPLPLGAEARAILLRSAELDALQLALAREVSGPSTDLVAIYLPGLDIAQHALLAAGERALSPSSVASRLDALREYYVCLDRLLSDALHTEVDELVVVVAQPGRVEATADGVIGMSGRAARPSAIHSGRSFDVAPTVLHALGVPISRTLAGAPLTTLMADDFVRRHPVRVIDTYGPPSGRRPDRAGQPLDQEAIDRLRSLGYVR